MLFCFFSSGVKNIKNTEIWRLCANELISLLQVEKESVQTTYTENDRSMLRYLYDCVFFVARKCKDSYCDDQEDQPAAKSQRLLSTDNLTWHNSLDHKRLRHLHLTSSKAKASMRILFLSIVVHSFASSHRDIRIFNYVAPINEHYCPRNNKLLRFL